MCQLANLLKIKIKIELFGGRGGITKASVGRVCRAGNAGWYGKIRYLLEVAFVRCGLVLFIKKKAYFLCDPGRMLMVCMFMGRVPENGRTMKVNYR